MAGLHIGIKQTKFQSPTIGLMAGNKCCPFFMSTNGYGVFRNTFAPRSYSFKDPVVTSHKKIDLIPYSL